jgi:hypothetical protein
MDALMRSRHVADPATLALCRLVCRGWAEWGEDAFVGALVAALTSRRPPTAAAAAWLERRVLPGQLDGAAGRRLVHLGLTDLARAGTSWPPSGVLGAALVAAAAAHGLTPFLREAAAALPERDRAGYVDVAAFAWRHERDDALEHLESLGYRFARPPEVVVPPRGDDWFHGRPCPVCWQRTIYKTCCLVHSTWTKFAPRARREWPPARWRGTLFAEDDHRCWGQDDDDVDGEHMCTRCRLGFYACDCGRLCRFLGGDGAWLARADGWAVDARDAAIDLPAHYVGDLGVEWMSVADSPDRGTMVVYACDGCHARHVLVSEPPHPWETEENVVLK